MASNNGQPRSYNAANELVNDGLDRGYDKNGNLVHTAGDSVALIGPASVPRQLRCGYGSGGRRATALCASRSGL